MQGTNNLVSCYITEWESVTEFSFGILIDDSTYSLAPKEDIIIKKGVWHRWIRRESSKIITSGEIEWVRIYEHGSG